MPAADDLFRPTASTPDEPASADQQHAPADRAAVSGVPRLAPAAEPVAPDEPEPSVRKPSGRVRHDEKMTVYVTSDELLDIEHARLGLRRTHGLAVDRGRLVREAVAMVLEDYEANGADSDLVRRLRES